MPVTFLLCESSRWFSPVSNACTWEKMCSDLPTIYLCPPDPEVGVIIGALVGALIGIAVIVSVVFFARSKVKSKQRKRNLDPSTELE